MAKRAAKRKMNFDDESDGPSVKSRNVKMSKSNDKRRLSRLEEYAEDEGRESSRNFQRWAEIFDTTTNGEAAKSRTFMKSFGAKAKKQTDRLRDYIQEQEKLLTHNKDQSIIVFEKVYSTIAVSLGSSGKPDDRAGATRKEEHALFKDYQALLSGSHSLLTQFKKTDERLKNYKIELPSAKWKQDKLDIKDLLACGREYGEKLVEKKLAPSGYLSHQPGSNKADEKEKIASELFKESHKCVDGNSWGVVAAEQVKRLRAIVNTIPSKELEKARY